MMASLTPIVVHRRQKGTYRLMPELLERIKAFEPNEWTVNLSEAFEEAFCQGSTIMVGLALVDDQGVMRGHCVAGMETFAGKTQPIIYQLAKDQGFDESPTATTSEIEAAVEAWAQMSAAHNRLDISHVFISVLDEKRERLFERFGYEKGPRLMRKELGNGLAIRRRIVND
jgi:hypothetical protein